MGNTFSLKVDSPVSEYLSMSNSTTFMFFDIFGLSGSRLAETSTEKMMIVWVLENDQSSIGLGMAGFEISDMPWYADCFEENKSFLLSVFEGCKQKLGWETLDYTPNEEFVIEIADGFSKMITPMTVDDMNQDAIDDWLVAITQDDPILNGFPKCPIHDILLCGNGCHACRN